MSSSTKRQLHRCSCSGENKKIKKTNIPQEFLDIETDQWKKLIALKYDRKIAYIYNPLDYAKQLHDDFVKKYCKGEKIVVLLGMNPGPWGMCQTGVPFGEVNHVKNWLKIEGEIKKPELEHELRPIEGFNCERKEVSGDRMWTLLKELSGEPHILFRHIFLHNYCPLAFLLESGKNFTPPEFKVKERRELEEICDAALIRIIKLLDVKHLICIGKYVRLQAQKALVKEGLTDVQISTLMHPSPVNPAANKGWKDIATKQLEEAGVLSLFNCP